MSSLFDFDNSQDLVFQAKTAGKQIISAKHEALTKLGAFLFLAHSENEFALRCQLFDNDINTIANRRLATVSDSKGKLVRALFAEWQLRHASCNTCKFAGPLRPMCKDCSNSNVDELVTTRDGKMGQEQLHPTEAYCADSKSCGLRKHQQQLGKAYDSYAQAPRKQAGLGDMINNLRGKGSNYGLTKDTSGNMTSDRGGQTAQGGFQGSFCGTVSGFMAHQQAGTAPCRDCTMANNIQTQRMTRDQAPVGKAYNSDAQADKRSSKFAKDEHNFYGMTGSCATCGGETGHKGGMNSIHEKNWHCPPGQCSTGLRKPTSSKGDLKTCAECDRNPATHKDVHGYLELCDSCFKNKKSSRKFAMPGGYDDYTNCDLCDEVKPVSIQNWSHAEPAHFLDGLQVCDDCSDKYSHLKGGTEASWPQHLVQKINQMYPENKQSSRDNLKGRLANEQMSLFEEEPGFDEHGNPNEAQKEYMRNKIREFTKNFGNGPVEASRRFASDKTEQEILMQIEELQTQLQQLVGNGESLGDVMRHDQGHDDWHRSMGQEPCTSEEDCNAKRQEHEAMEHEQHTAGMAERTCENCDAPVKRRFGEDTSWQPLYCRDCENAGVQGRTFEGSVDDWRNHYFNLDSDW